MSDPEIHERYRELESYVGWTDADAARLREAAPLVERHADALVEDFYATIDRHESTRRVIEHQAGPMDRLKARLRQWIAELVGGTYDADYVERRWRVGYRHVEIGLSQVYTSVAMARLRMGLVRAVESEWQGPGEGLRATLEALNKRLDLDLALIEDAYRTEQLGRLRRHERLATLGQVAGGVAHELRNPLNVIKSSAYFLVNARQLTPEKLAEHAGRIDRQVERADAVITALSGFARLGPPELRPVAVDDLLQAALEANPPGPAVEAVVEVPEAIPPVLADRDQVLIVLGNLIRNANEAMGDGGRLGLSAGRDGGFVWMAVSDTGPGIDPAGQARMLEPLYSTKARGLGLGLAIARSLAEKNQGRLTVRSEPGVGTTVEVRLRAAEGEGGEIPGPGAPEHGIPDPQ